MKKQGFTLVEIMIVVLIIGLLAAIAIPNFIKARKTTQMNACIDNLRVIQGAVEQFRMEGKGDPDNVAALCGADNYIKVEPKCPSNKTSGYSLEGDEKSPKCDAIAVEGYPHVLPGGATDTAAPGTAGS